MSKKEPYTPPAGKEFSRECPLGRVSPARWPGVWCSGAVCAWWLDGECAMTRLVKILALNLSEMSGIMEADFSSKQ